MASWITDQGAHDDFGKDTAVVDMKNYVRVSYEDLKKELHPTETFFYIDQIPEKDGWGHPYEFYLVMKKPHMSPRAMAIRSPGRDGIYQCSKVYQKGDFPSDNFDEDLVWADGFYVRWAAKQPEN